MDVVGEALHVRERTVGVDLPCCIAGGADHVLAPAEVPLAHLHAFAARVVHLPPVVKVDVGPAVVCEAGILHRLRRGLRLLGRESVAERVPAVPSHRRRERDCVAHREADRASRPALRVRRRHLDVVVSWLGRRDAAQDALRVERHAVRQTLRRERDRTFAGRRHAEDDLVARPHAPDVRAVDARLRLLRRSEDAKLRCEGWVVHRLDLRAILASEARIQPVGVRRVKGRPLPAAGRLDDDLLYAGKVHMHGNWLLPELEVARRPDDTAVRPHLEARGRLAVALAGPRALRVVVDRDERVKRGDLAVRTEQDRAFRMRAEAPGVGLAGHRQRIAVNRLVHLNPLAAAARRPGKVKRADIRHIRERGHAGDQSRYHHRFHFHVKMIA